MKTSKELKQKIKSIINQLPDEIEGRCPYELMIYTTYEEGQSDLEEFYKFNGVISLDKAIDNIIKGTFLHFFPILVATCVPFNKVFNNH
jgi:hypothetical protein